MRGGGEKDSSVSLTWQVYHTSQWGETWRWRPGGREDEVGQRDRDTARDNTGDGVFVGACVHEERRESGGASAAGWWRRYDSMCKRPFYCSVRLQKH